MGLFAKRFGGREERSHIGNIGAAVQGAFETAGFHPIRDFVGAMARVHATGFALLTPLIP